MVSNPILVSLLVLLFAFLSVSFGVLCQSQDRDQDVGIWFLFFSLLLAAQLLAGAIWNFGWLYG